MTYFQIRRVRSEVRWALRLWSTGFVLAARHITNVRYRLEGLEKLPDRPVIFVGNHQSYWESIAFTCFVPNINVVTWSRVMDIPIFGWGLREAPMIPVHRDQPGANLRKIVRETRANLAEGRSILFFPEGHRVRPGLTLPYQRGLGVMYAAADAWIVPVVNNAALSWADGFRVKPGGEITIRFLDPIPPGGNPSQTARELEVLLNTEKDRLPGTAG
ncbi:MAG: lysophospholipid acyltransferase family protein [Pseudomonadota bacterium]